MEGEQEVPTKREKTSQEKIQIATNHKNEGNEHFKAKDYRKALGQYHRAYLYLKGFRGSSGGNTDFIQQMAGSNTSGYDYILAKCAMKCSSCLPKTVGVCSASLNTEEREQVNNLLVAVHCNMAVCHLELKMAERAVEDCNNALNIDSKCTKALFRKGQAYLQLRDTDRAKEALQNASQLAPKDSAILRELRKVREMEQTQKDKQKKAFAGLFDRMNKEESNTENPSSDKQEQKEPAAEHQAQNE
ncbi:40 kDa peptidyl-prolyl cis-trans isomerase [Balamuthia mandrillaris]